MSPKPTGYAELYAANVADDHYHQRRNACKPACLRLAEEVYQKELENLGILDTLNDRGLVGYHELHIAGLAFFAAQNVKNKFTDAWWCEVNARAAELEAFKDGKLGYSLTEGAWVAHNIEVQS